MNQLEINEILKELNAGNESSSRFVNNKIEKIWIEKLYDANFTVFRIKRTKKTNGIVPSNWEFEENLHFDNEKTLTTYLDSLLI